MYAEVRQLDRGRAPGEDGGMIAEEISKRIKRAMKEGDAVAREVLRVALGEIQTAEARAGSLSDADAAAIVRKLIKSNDETMAATSDEGARATLRRENEVLRELLPATLGVAQIVEALSGVADAVRAAPNDGAATGVAMKALKAAKAEVTGKDVAEAVRALRSG
ncbi:MAG TPA: GatB/YqeY domain-containing protein [Polyangiaceae bacterium]|nr:GatB/YqeY domain-containing protein [Polyangiaceae bacterium]